MLMRSPVHPSLAKWALREQPTGRRRLAAAYLTAGVGAATSLVIIALTLMSTRHCQVTRGGADLGCLAGFFHGLSLSILAGLIVLSGAAIFIKLGLRYVAGLLALAAPVVLIAQLLSILGAESRPYVLVALVGVPAAASWLSARLTAEPAPGPTAAVPSPRPHSTPVRTPHRVEV